MKRAAGTFGERLGLLKLNGRLTSRSPLTPLTELEGLELLLAHHAALWRSLETIGVARATELAERAEGHAEALRPHRRDAARSALAQEKVK